MNLNKLIFMECNFLFYISRELIFGNWLIFDSFQKLLAKSAYNAYNTKLIYNHDGRPITIFKFIGNCTEMKNAK